jgi:extracellular elastinolytic metalloproteinase
MSVTGRLSGRSSGVLAILAGALLLGPAGTAAADGVLEDRDARKGRTAPTAQQERLAERRATSVRWNRFGTPQSLIRHGGFLATGIQGESARRAAKRWLSDNRAMFGLDSTAGLQVRHAGRLRGSSSRVVVLRQRFGGLPAGVDGTATLGLVPSGGGWNLAYVSSSMARDTGLKGERKLSPTEAWAKAAADVGRAVGAGAIGAPKRQGGWTAFAVDGFAQAQRAREVAVPLPGGGARRAYETLLTDSRAGDSTAYTHFVDAETGAVLIRQDNVMHSHPAAETFEGSVATEDGACTTEGPWTVAAGERLESVAAAVEATLTTNDVVLNLKRDGTTVASGDTLFSPEAVTYDPPDAGTGTYTLDVCDFVDGEAWAQPNTYDGQIAFNGAAGTGTAAPYPPMWKVFPATPLMGDQTFPWNYPSTDIRELWCWESTVGSPPRPVTGPGGESCDREVQNLASRFPWDVNGRTQQPTFTTSGNNASSAEAWFSPLTPGGAQRPVSLQRQYVYPWENRWHTRGAPQPGCSQENFTPAGNDIDAAVTNLFAMHNRMHDWAYFLGFDERRWNAQDSNFGTGGTAEGDPVLGDAQAGAVSGGFPSYLGRDNANMIPNPDGVAPITNMYLWQPIAGAFYAPCVDGDYDMAVIGHEYGHLIENRMIGKGGRRSQHHAGAMGESFGDLMGVEQLIESGYVPVGDENPFGVGTYVTGNKDRAIRNYGMDFPRTGAFPTPSVSLVKRGGPLVDPLGFANMGYDITGPQVHADGEIWSATNHDIRAALAAKYDSAFPSSDRALQRSCADGERPADQCPGNRRWMQIVFDAYVLMPVAPSMLDARDAYLAADVMRFGGANQAELWLAFARRGFGEGASSTNTANDTDTDPTPDHASPRHADADVSFRAVASDEGGAPVSARIYTGHYEARTSPIADTDPATTGQNLDDRAQFAPGTYEFVAHAPGYGHVRVRRTFAAGSSTTVTLQMPTNRASRSKGATAFGDGTDHAQLIDDTEATSWDRTAARPDVRGSQVTVDLQGARQTISRAHVSALLEVGRNRFTALRQFRIDVSEDGTNFRPHYTSPADAFPGFNPRPVAPEMILREFSFPAVEAVAVRIVVLENQCTGNTAFQGDQDADLTSGSDCRLGSPGAGPVPVFGDLPQVVAPRDDEVHIAELQVFSR